MASQSLEIREEERFQAEVNSKLEPWLIDNICQPVLERLPESVHPNTISLFNHLICWCTLGLAAASVYLPPLQRSMALLGASIGTFTSLLADCLDGMQARRTGRCSKVGEMLDHWLDTINVPLTSVGMTLALQMEPWAVILVNISAAMIYSSQLVFYHHSGRFVHPPTSGADAQFGISLGYIAMALVFMLVDRSSQMVSTAVSTIAIASIVVQMKMNFFYYTQLKREVLHHIPFVFLCGAFGVLYLLDIVGTLTFVLSVVFISFRLCGSYVLYTIVKERFNGNDWGILFFIGTIAIGHYWVEPYAIGQTTLQACLPTLTFIYIITRNLWDVVRYYPYLRDHNQPHPQSISASLQ